MFKIMLFHYQHWNIHFQMKTEISVQVGISSFTWLYNTWHLRTKYLVVNLTNDTYIGSVDGGWPPQCEATVGDLVETGPLRIGQLLVLHALLKTAGLLPEQTLPRGEICALKVRTNTFFTQFYSGLLHRVGYAEFSFIFNAWIKSPNQHKMNLDISTFSISAKDNLYLQVLQLTQ